MSIATKRKYVTQEVLDNYFVPEDPYYIVKVVAGRGNNLHQVETPDGESYLVSMPTKFRKNVWIKRGDFVVVEPIEEGDKVKAEIVHILQKDQIKYIKDEGKWPSQFDNKESKSDDKDSEIQFSNPNRTYVEDESSSENEESDSTSDESDSKPFT